jgi:phosphatidylinositol glycan class V
VSAGVLLSNVFHLCSVFALYHFARTALSPKQNPNVPFIAALLHVLSPAGLFLSAPYSESLFSAINFTGMTYYVLAKRAGAAAGTWSGAQDVYMLTSGLVFAGATFVRSNGLLNGLIFLYDVACVVRRVLAFQFKMHDARRLLVACVAGAILSTGYIVPQLEAYRQYCMSGSGSPRSWCLDLVPSIYSWVQKHYW